MYPQPPNASHFQQTGSQASTETGSLGGRISELQAALQVLQQQGLVGPMREVEEEITNLQRQLQSYEQQKQHERNQVYQQQQEQRVLIDCERNIGKLMDEIRLVQASLHMAFANASTDRETVNGIKQSNQGIQSSVHGLTDEFSKLILECKARKEQTTNSLQRVEAEIQNSMQ